MSGQASSPKGSFSNVAAGCSMREGSSRSINSSSSNSATAAGAGGGRYHHHQQQPQGMTAHPFGESSNSAAALPVPAVRRTAPAAAPLLDESSPLIVRSLDGGILPPHAATVTAAISRSPALALSDEENGISLIAPSSDNGQERERPSSDRGSDTSQGRGSDRRFDLKTTGGKSSAQLPSWSQAFAEVSPFLRPRDRRHLILASLALLTVLLEKLVAVLPPLAIRHAVDAISGFGTIETFDNSGDETSFLIRQKSTAKIVSMSILVYFLLRMLNAAISSLQGVCQRAVSLDAERRFASTLFAHLQMLGAAYHLERHAGELLQILSRGSNATSTIIDSLWFQLAPTLFEAMVVGTVFWKLLGIPAIAFTTVASVALYLVYTVMVTNTRLEQRRKVIEASDEVGRIETETLINYETVVMFGREKKEVDAYDAVRKDYTEERVKMLGLFSWLQLGQQTIRLAGTCIGLWLAGRATVYGTGLSGSNGDDLLSPGSFVVVQLYIQQLFQPLSFLGFTYRQLTEALTDLEKAVNMLRSNPLVTDAKDAVEWDDALERQQQEWQREQRLHTKLVEEFSNKKVTSTPLRSKPLFRFGFMHIQQRAEHRKKEDDPPMDDDEKDGIFSSGDITFDNVSFRYKVKSQRKRLGGPDVTEEGFGMVKLGRRGRRGGGRGRSGYGGKGMGMGGRGHAIWKGNGGANFWIKDAKKNEGDKGGEKETDKVVVGGIENVSFHIPAGWTAALVGPSGSGKTTIVRLILRMYDPDKGSVSVDNINVKSLLQQSLRSNIGVVAQDTVLFHASLRDNIIYGKEDATEEEVWEAVRTSALEPLVTSLPDGLDTFVGERGMKLSGGERQRVGLARCIIKRPKLILLDEATSALDSGTEREIQRNILTSKTAAAVCRGRTTLMIAHRLSTARRADIILVLDKGRLVERGTHEELLALGAEGGMYARMWRDQMEGDSLDELK